MDLNIERELQKVNLIECLEEECNLSEQLATEVVEDLMNPQEPAYVCTTAEELSAALAEMSEG